MNTIYQFKRKLLSAVGISVVLFAIGGCSEPQTQQPKQPEGAAEATSAQAPQVSVQLYSVKDSLKADFKGTLEQIANLGFDGVEFAGDFGPYAEDPEGLKDYLASIGLQASGAHVGIDQLKNNFDNTTDFYKKLGASWLIIPWDDRAFNGDDVKAVAEDLSALAEKLKPLDMRVGFHNHAQEWQDYGDASYLEYLAENTPKSVILQQDVGWTIDAGEDPIAFVKHYPGRTLTTHFKSDVAEDSQYVPIIGKDNIDWKAVYTATITDGGAKWIVIEQEEYPNGLSPMEALTQSKAGFDGIIKSAR
ncbi:sugar phosphate isomerase/epimerase [Alteromonas pelagimontana]|uniref:Sugar phosphate isomerase/epimerase n=1 Tax=Alteromonas pelagimontana TaxID=1858656 RepID=A0A6M4MGG8_9ALTE|nr:sugar phosphate isomerase/epimerase [Alteromonas pelagimontana]QJR82284.1 sugar phosphate isomerase/epimerase [Alteromonas pelagimontana]